tara:strand:- start:16836 stop:17837 length:1002 start_codon:yes stop_codon:yes gene_type:complete
MIDQQEIIARAIAKQLHGDESCWAGQYVLAGIALSALPSDLYVPGVWRCPKCQFELMQSNLNSRDGTVTARDEAGDKCPNCKTALWRVSWKDWAIETGKRLDETWDELQALKKAMPTPTAQLVWDDFGGGKGAKAKAFYDASYLITRWSTGKYEVAVSYPGHQAIFDGPQFYDTLNIAKSAAQTDYEHRLPSMPPSTDRWKAQAQQATSVIAMIRAMIGEIFGPTASIESQDATLLRGPEAKHEGEAILEALQRIHAAQPSPADSVVLDNIEPEDGFWRSCSGCHETNEGAETGHYPYSKVFQCYFGSGCRECGGLGVVWDNTDYSAIAGEDQ